MSFSDDHSSPAAPFSGDETGAIFDAPDLVLQSPTTTERVVETQSGFLVVVRRVEEQRQALSVKRRLGTPPTSSVLLTPDESVKLSRILSDSHTAAQRRTVSPRAHEEMAASGAKESEEQPKVCRGGSGSRPFDARSEKGALPTERLEEWLSSDPTLASLTQVKSGSGKSNAFVRHGLRGIILPVILTALLVVAIAFMAQSSRLPGKKIVVTATVDPLEAKNVEPFVHKFVANLLDFNPETYRVSQIRAMAALTPELVESYWTDTRFPMTAKQLKALPQDTTVMINKIVAQRLDDKNAATDVYAQLVNEKSKIGSPIHLKLKLVLDGEGELRVSEQKDLTASAP